MSKNLLYLIRVGALDAGDSFSVIPTRHEVFDYFRDPLQAEAAVCGSIHFLIAFGKIREVLFEDGLKDIRSALSVCRGRIQRSRDSCACT